MKRHSKRQPRPRPGWLELLTGGILLFLLLTGSLWSFSSAVGQPFQMSVFLGGCVLLTILLTVLCALPTRWMLAVWRYGGCLPPCGWERSPSAVL